MGNKSISKSLWCDEYANRQMDIFQKLKSQWHLRYASSFLPLHIQTQWWDDALDIHLIPAGTLTAKYTHTTQMDRVVYLIAQPPMAHGMPVPVGIFELEFVNIRSTFCETGKKIDGDLFLFISCAALWNSFITFASSLSTFYSNYWCIKNMECDTHQKCKMCVCVCEPNRKKKKSKLVNVCAFFSLWRHSTWKLLSKCSLNFNISVGTNQ